MRLKIMSMLLVLAGCGVGTIPAEQEPAIEPAKVVEPTQQLAVIAPPKPKLFDAYGKRVVRDETSPVALELSTDTVFCSAFGYGASFLKVSVPDLDFLAHFDHRVQTTGLPCAAAGACSDTLNPESILQDRPGVEVVDVRVILTEHLTVDATAKTCTRELKETIQMNVRGVPLFHEVDGDPEVVSFDVCTALLAQ